MMSAWKEPSGQSDRTDGHAAERDENQLELFEILPPASMPTMRPSSVNGDAVVVTSGPGRGAEAAVAAGPNSGGKIVGPAATRDFLDVGAVDSDDLRRLEESIRWLMNAGTVPLPRTASLTPV